MEILDQSVNNYLRSNNVTGLPLIELNLTLKKGYILASADITRLKFFSPSLAHIAFLVHNFEFLVQSITIKFPSESETPPITSIDDFYTFLNSIQLFSTGLEFKYITDTKNNLKQWQAK
jgi:hypothetical protein